MEQYLGLPPDGSAHGPAIDHLIGLLHWLMLALFIGWGCFYVYTLIRFRKSRNPKASYTGVKNHASSYLEVGVLLVEAALLVGFSIPLWSKRVDAFPNEQDATVVRVVAEQFAWNIHYPGRDGKFGKTSISLIDGENPLGLDRSDPDAKDDIMAINQLNLPVNKPVIIHLSTKDVIHSLNLPTFRVKQDAIPGMGIPLWFTPTKTTDEIREELRRTFSIAEAMAASKRVSLPPMTMLPVKRGSGSDDAMVMNDIAGKDGAPVLSKGEHLNDENVSKLADAGITEVPARIAAGMDKYVLMEEQKDNAGAIIAGRNEALTEEMVSKLVAAGMKEVMARRASNVDPFVVMESYTDKSGAAIASKGDPLSEETIAKLADAGIMEILVAPATPTEIACAQLCGLGHYRMRGYVTVQKPEEFQRWFDEQEAALQPPPADPAATQGTH